MTQTLSFHLPSNSGSVSVITPAIQKEVTDAVLAAITLASGGQAPSNISIVPTFLTSSSDGSITISFLIDATLSKIVNTTIFISAVTYAADPAGSTAIAIKSASGGNKVQDVAITLTTAARQASVSVCALVNATTTPTTNTLVSRIANVIQKNASSIIATAVCAKVEDAIISNVFGVINSAAGIATAEGGLSITEILQSGGVAGLIGAFIAFLLLYLMARRRTGNSTINKNNINTSRDAKIKSLTSSPMASSLQQQPRPPKRNPPKHAFSSFHQSSSSSEKTNVTGSGAKSTKNSDNSLATTMNPLRQGQSTTALSLPRRRSRGDLTA